VGFTFRVKRSIPYIVLIGVVGLRITT